MPFHPELLWDDFTGFVVVLLNAAGAYGLVRAAPQIVMSGTGKAPPP